MIIRPGSDVGTTSLVQPPLHPEAADTAGAIADYDRLTVDLAADDDGEMQRWRPATVPALAIVGECGSGKTVTAQNAAAQFARAHWAVHIAACYDEYGQFADWPNVRAVAVRPTEQFGLVNYLADLLWQRLRVNARHAPAVLVVDSLCEVVKNVDVAGLDELLRLGMRARIHVLATSYDDRLVSAEIRDKLATLLLRRRDYGSMAHFEADKRRFAQRDLAVLRPARSSYGPVAVN
ncbi:ATP-binding protein [Mycobacterium hubeiense]|uniref:ATP-binding protein n=1 Tax=Mycobacterium hubeiense TaxID=1867256 RepID=UPI000C7EEA3D|nr:ATP-binding protein [Mycobacterium sp. QGD 101]